MCRFDDKARKFVEDAVAVSRAWARVDEESWTSPEGSVLETDDDFHTYHLETPHTVFACLHSRTYCIDFSTKELDFRIRGNLGGSHVRGDLAPLTIEPQYRFKFLSGERGGWADLDIDEAEESWLMGYVAVFNIAEHAEWPPRGTLMTI